MIARLFNRSGCAIDWRRLELLRDDVVPPEAIVIWPSRVFLRWDIHPIKDTAVLAEAERRVSADEMCYLEVTADSPPAYWER
jgi:hypothetical protein